MKGSCICGSVSFTVSESLPAIYQCHCTLCQKQSGAGGNAATILNIDSFKWINGTSSIKQWQKETVFNSHFCNNCGCPVPNPIGAKHMWVPVGLIENAKTKVVAHMWLESKSEWDISPEALRNYQGMPENLEEFIKFLYSNKIT